MKTVFFLTIYPLPHSGGGGPGGVIKRLVENINKNKNILGWQAKYLAGENTSLADMKNEEVGFIDTTKKIIKDVLSVNKNLLRLVKSFWDITTIKTTKQSIFRYQNFLQKYLLDLIRCEIIHTHDIFAAYALFGLFKQQQIKKKHVCLSIHSPGGSATAEIMRRRAQTYHTLYTKWLKKIELFAIKKSTCLILPSQGALRYLLDDFPEIKEREGNYYVVYNGIEPFKNYRKGEMRQEFNLTDKTLIITAMGRLVKDKGFDILIKAIEILLKMHPDRDIHLFIAGTGPESSLLKRIIIEKKLEKQIHLLGFRDDVSDILSDTDIFVSPGRVSAFDLSILEAISAAIPIIATDVGGNSEALNYGEGGVLVQPENPDALANALLKLLLNPKYRTELAEKGLSLFNRCYTIDVMVKNLLNTYGQILKYSEENITP